MNVIQDTCSLKVFMSLVRSPFKRGFNFNFYYLHITNISEDAGFWGLISNLSAILLTDDLPNDKIENQMNFEVNKNRVRAKSRGFKKAKVTPLFEQRNNIQSQFIHK